MGFFHLINNDEGSWTEKALWVVLYVVTLHAIVKKANTWYRLRHIPGPWFAGISRLWLARVMLKGNWHLITHELFEKHGPVIRTGPNNVCVNELSAYRQVYGTKSKYRKGSYYDAFKFDPSQDSIISSRDTKYHDRVRSILAPGYSGKDVEGLENLVDFHIAALINLIETKYLSNDEYFRPMDLATKSQYFTLDLISSIAFGPENIFGFLEKDDDVNRYLEVTESSLPFMTFLSTYPELAAILQSPLLRGLMPSDKDTIGLGPLIKIAKQVVADRFSNKTSRKDMLNSFISHGLTRKEAESEVLTAIVAGGDTTSTAIRCTLLYLTTSPIYYGQLKDEMVKGIAEGRISSPITDAEARKLPFLQAVIKESLRVHPPVAHLQAMETPAGGDTISGVFIPAGTQVSNGVWSTVHNKKIFGPDADLFRPERWLEADEQTLGRWNTAVDFIFHGPGKWGCLGKPLALVDLNKVFVELLRRFDFTIVNPISPMRSYNAGLFLQSEMWVKVTRSSS